MEEDRSWCCLCGAWERRDSLAAHVMERHVGASARILWQCGECTFDGTEIVAVAAHCFATGHDVARMGQSQPREIVRQFKRVQLQAQAAPSPPSQASASLSQDQQPSSSSANSAPAPATATATPTTTGPDPTFTTEIRTGRTFSLDDLGLPNTAASPSQPDIQPPSLKRGPPSISGASGGESGDGDGPSEFAKALRLAETGAIGEDGARDMRREELEGRVAAALSESGGWPHPRAGVTPDMEERALSRSGGGLDEKSMKAYAWTLTREVYTPELLLAGFECVSTSLKFGRYSQARSAAEMLSKQPLQLQSILASTARRFGFAPGGDDATSQSRIRTVLDHLKTNRYNIRRKLACPCGHCKKANDLLVFSHSASAYS